MSLFSSPLSLPSLPDQFPNRMMSLARGLENGEEINLSFRASSNVGIMSIDNIIEYLYSGKGSELSPIYWIYLVSRKDDWDYFHPNQAENTATLMWLTSLNNLWLKEFLLNKMIDVISSKEVLTQSIINSFPQFKDQLSNHPLARFAELAMDPSTAAYKIAEMSLIERVTPQELFESRGLFAQSRITKESCELCSAIFVNEFRKNENLTDWLVKCLEALTEDAKPIAINQILTQISREQGVKFPLLLKWIKNNFNPRETKNQKRWNLLSNNAKLKYREWLGSASYQDFLNLINHVIDELDLSKEDKDRLNSRKDFWSNYSQRFEYIRIFAPQKTFSVISNNYSLASKLTADIELIKCDVGEETEVCVFAFENFFVVELFRGINEVRIFERTAKSESYFMESPTLTSGIIRSLGGRRHDHAFVWQYFFERKLSDLGVFPNSGLKNFCIRGSEYRKYSVESGMGTPAPEKQLERKKKLIAWNEKMDTLELEARGLYSNLGTLK